MEHETVRRVAQRLVLASRATIDLCRVEFRKGHMTPDEYQRAVAGPKQRIQRIQALFRDTEQPIY